MDKKLKSKTKKDNIIAVLKKEILYGIILLATGIFLFYMFKDYEESGGRMRMNVIVLIIYKFTGKLGTLVILEALGFISLFLGLRKILRISINKV